MELGLGKLGTARGPKLMLGLVLVSECGFGVGVVDVVRLFV